jgi:glucose-1-phosphate cytidylyltransferase
VASVSVYPRVKDSKWVVMLCGGLGSRMGSLTEDCPKPMLLVRGKPIIWYSFWSLYNKGFRNFILPIGFLGHVIRNYVTEITKDLDCNISFVETGRDACIASRIQQILHLIPENKDFFLINSDTLFAFDIDGMLKHHVAKNALVTLSSVEIISPWGVLTVCGDDIIDFDRDRKIQRLVSSQVTNGYGVVNSGLAWINKSALHFIDFENILDFETDLFRAVIAEKKMSHFALDGIWVPIDTPKDLEAINYIQSSDEKHDTLVKELGISFHN